PSADAHPALGGQGRLVNVAVAGARQGAEIEPVGYPAARQRREIARNRRRERDRFHVNAGVTTRSAPGTHRTSSVAELARLYSPSVSYAGGAPNVSVKLDACVVRTSGLPTCVPLVAAPKSATRLIGDAAPIATASNSPSVTLAPGAMRNAPPKFFPLAITSMRCGSGPRGATSTVMPR